MSPGVKATMVIVALFGFFAMAVVGPMIGNASSSVVESVLGYDEETKVENQKKLANQDYKASGVLNKAVKCCLQCKADWNYFEDRCDLTSRSAIACYMKKCAN